jgi:hypothetical protein
MQNCAIISIYIECQVSENASQTFSHQKNLAMGGEL